MIQRVIGGLKVSVGWQPGIRIELEHLMVLRLACGHDRLVARPVTTAMVCLLCPAGST